jgi:hypothetical protein
LLSVRLAASRSALAALALGLAGCASDVGDLGRARPSAWNDALYPGAGYYLAWARGEQVSSFPLTDDEIELRGRAWRFLMPAHERSWFDKNVQELARTRIIPVSWQTIEPDRYGPSLMSGPFRSEHSRYRRLSEDAAADAALLAPFMRNARAVNSADKARMRMAEASPAIAPGKPLDAAARVAENDGLIAWVCERTRFRIANYRHALDNLVVELPSSEAVMAERAVLGLEAHAKACGGLVVEAYKLGPPLVVKD